MLKALKHKKRDGGRGKMGKHQNTKCEVDSVCKSSSSFLEAQYRTPCHKLFICRSMKNGNNAIGTATISSCKALNGKNKALRPWTAATTMWANVKKTKRKQMNMRIIRETDCCTAWKEKKIATECGRGEKHEKRSDRIEKASSISCVLKLRWLISIDYEQNAEVDTS